MTRPLFPVLLGLAILAAAPAEAQGQCEASTPLGRFVCDVPALGIRSAELRALEAQIFTSLPEDGREALVEAQTQWRQYVTDLCLVTTPRLFGDSTAAGEAVQCVGTALSARLKDLPRFQERQGGLTFRRREVFAAGPIANPPPGGQTVWSIEAAYPVLLELSPAAGAWSRLAASRFRALLDYDPTRGAVQRVTQDELIDYSIQYANDRAVGITWHRWTYGHGAAHGNPADVAMHFRLDEARALAPADVFHPGSGWEAALPQLAFDDLKRRHGNALLVKTPAEIAAQAVSPDRWIFTGEGLTVFFNVYEVMPYAEGRRDVKLPWSRLTPYLRNGRPPDFAAPLPVFLRR